MTSETESKSALIDLFKQDASHKASILLIPLPFLAMFLAFGVNPQLVNTVSCSIALIGLVVTTYIAMITHEKFVQKAINKWEKLADFLNANPEDDLARPIVLAQFDKKANLGFNIVLDKNQKFQFGDYLACERVVPTGHERVPLPDYNIVAKFIEADNIKVETKVFNFDKDDDVLVYYIFAPLSVLNVINVDKP